MSSLDMKAVTEGLMRAMSGEERVREPRRAPVLAPGSTKKMPMEEVLSRLPKRKLTVDDFKQPELMKMKREADQEASLPPEKAPLKDRTVILRNIESQRQIVEMSHPGQMGLVMIERAQIYSSAKMKNLIPVHISEMMLRKTHKGQYLLCRTINPAVFDGGIGFLLGVEDPQGETACLKLLNHPILLETVKEEHDLVLPIGTVLAVREPTYISDKTFIGLPHVRIDSPSDVIFVDPSDPILNDVSWKTSLDAPPPLTGEEWKAKALKHFKAAQWFSAAICFSNCMKLGFDEQVSRLNRAEVYLRLGWNRAALRDAQDAFKSGTLSDDLVVKAIVRSVKAQYALGRYNEALENAKSLPEDKTVIEWVTKAKQRIQEQKTGNYDWFNLIKYRNNAYSPDVADFTGPLEFKKGQNGVRGTFATGDVKAGELLMLHKPVSSLPSTDKSKLTKQGLRLIDLQAFKVINDRAPYRHFCKVLQRIWDDKQMYDTVRALYAGDTQKEPNAFPPPSGKNQRLENPTQPVVDIDVEYVQGAVHVNSFESGNAMVFYAAPSLVNHSCMPTAKREFFGDAFVLRAIQDMKKGEEVTIAYLGETIGYDERQFRLMNSWRFSCSCKLCEADEEDGFEAREKRRSLLIPMNVIGDKINMVFDLPTVQRLYTDAKKTMDALKKTYKAGRSEKVGDLKYELANPLRLYANTADRMGRAGPVTMERTYFKQSIELKMESLDVSGLKVTDRTMAGAILGASKKGQKSLPVDTSHVPSDHEISVITVLEIAKFFKESSDERRARRWFDTALWLEKAYSGGGIDVFKMRHSTPLTIFGLADYI